MSEALNLPPTAEEPQTLPVGTITLGWTKALLGFNAEVLVGTGGSYRWQAATQSMKGYFVFVLGLVTCFLRKSQDLLGCFQSLFPNRGAIKHQDSTKEDFSLCRAVN